MRRQAGDRDRSLAWHVALFMRQERLPPLSTALTPTADRVGQGPQQMRTALGIIADAFGLTVQQAPLAEIFRA